MGTSLDTGARPGAPTVILGGQPGPVALSAPAEDAARVWSVVLDRLRGTLNAATFGMIFERARAVSLTPTRIQVAVETDFARTWILQRYHTVLKDALFEVLGVDIHLDVEVAPTEAPPPGEAPAAEAPAAAPAPVPARGGSSQLQARFTFETFVMGPSNRLAHAAAMAVAEMPARSYNPLFIYGGVGLGKTHLLHAIGHFTKRYHDELTLRYVSVETFTNEFINALRDGGMRSFKDRYRNVDVLLIDDIQSLAGREQTQEEFFHTFNALHDSGKQIVISSDRPPKAIATLEERLRSRFEMGLMTDIQPPDVETRIAILQKRVQHDGYKIHDPDVLPYIASRITTNVRQLEGALTRVVAHGSIGGRPVTVDLAREVLQDLLASDDETIDIAAVQGEVCRYYGVSMAELKGQKRTKRLVVPRQVAMYLCRELTDSSLPQIGRSFGGRDHSTVIYAVQKVKEQISQEGEVYGAVQDLTRRLSST
ncbi:MAG: chromosomal replication initiator protein DnaA [Actinomycetota bacterium]